MANLKLINRYLKYPLMWVMLLWALTLPGHEALVYNFMVKGSIAEVASMQASTATDEGLSVKKQAVRVFADADTASFKMAVSHQAVKCFLQLLVFALPADEDAAAYTDNFICNNRLSQISPISILPNAP